MSIILDALRGGRTPETGPKKSNPAQTDAVLATLGYGRFSPSSPLNKLKRAIGYGALALALAATLWVVVVVITKFLVPSH